MKLIVALLLLATAISCTHDIENRSVVGETFPKVNGNSLSGKKWNLPGDFKAKKTLLLIGYEQNTQFDIDRWLVALDDRKVKVDLYEIPTVAGLVPLPYRRQNRRGNEVWNTARTMAHSHHRIQRR